MNPNNRFVKNYADQKGLDEEAGWKCLVCESEYDFDFFKRNEDDHDKHRLLDNLDVRAGECPGIFRSRVPMLMGGCSHTICARCYFYKTERRHGIQVYNQDEATPCVQIKCPLCKKNTTREKCPSPGPVLPINASLIVARTRGFTAMVDLSQEEDTDSEEDRKMPARSYQAEYFEEMEEIMAKTREYEEEQWEEFKKAVASPDFEPMDHDVDDEVIAEAQQENKEEEDRRLLSP